MGCQSSKEDVPDEYDRMVANERRSRHFEWKQMLKGVQSRKEIVAPPLDIEPVPYFPQPSGTITTTIEFIAPPVDSDGHFQLADITFPQSSLPSDIAYIGHRPLHGGVSHPDSLPKGAHPVDALVHHNVHTRARRNSVEVVASHKQIHEDRLHTAQRSLAQGLRDPYLNDFVPEWQRVLGADYVALRTRAHLARGHMLCSDAHLAAHAAGDYADQPHARVLPSTALSATAAADAPPTTALADARAGCWSKDVQGRMLVPRGVFTETGAWSRHRSNSDTLLYQPAPAMLEAVVTSRAALALFEAVEMESGTGVARGVVEGMRDDWARQQDFEAHAPRDGQPVVAQEGPYNELNPRPLHPRRTQGPFYTSRADVDVGEVTAERLAMLNRRGWVLGADMALDEELVLAAGGGMERLYDYSAADNVLDSDSEEEEEEEEEPAGSVAPRRLSRQMSFSATESALYAGSHSQARLTPSRMRTHNRPASSASMSESSASMSEYGLRRVDDEHDDLNDASRRESGWLGEGGKVALEETSAVAVASSATYADTHAHTRAQSTTVHSRRSEDVLSLSRRSSQAHAGPGSDLDDDHHLTGNRSHSATPVTRLNVSASANDVLRQRRDSTLDAETLASMSPRSREAYEALSPRSRSQYLAARSGSPRAHSASSRTPSVALIPVTRLTVSRTSSPALSQTQSATAPTPATVSTQPAPEEAPRPVSPLPVVDYATAVKDRYLPVNQQAPAAHKFSRMNNHDEVDRLTAESRRHRASLVNIANADSLDDMYHVDESPNRGSGRGAYSASSSAYARGSGSRLSLSELVHGPREPHPDSVPFDVAAVEEAAADDSRNHGYVHAPEHEPVPEVEGEPMAASASTSAPVDPSAAPMAGVQYGADAQAFSPMDARLGDEPAPRDTAPPKGYMGGKQRARDTEQRMAIEADSQYHSYRAPPSGGAAAAAALLSAQAAETSAREQAAHEARERAAREAREQQQLQQQQRRESRFKGLSFDGPNASSLLRPKPQRGPAAHSRNRRQDSVDMHLSMDSDADVDADPRSAGRRNGRTRTPSVTPRGTPAKSSVYGVRRPQTGVRDADRSRGYDEQDGYADLPSSTLRPPRNSSSYHGLGASESVEALIASGTLEDEMEQANDMSIDRSLDMGGRYYVPKSLPTTPAFKKQKVVRLPAAK